MHRLLNLVCIVVFCTLSAKGAFILEVTAKDALTRMKMDANYGLLYTYEDVPDSLFNRLAEGTSNFDGIFKLREKPKRAIIYVYPMTYTIIDGKINWEHNQMYEPVTQDVDIPEDSNGKFELTVPVNRKKQKELDDFTFEATKVKFYHKGDTLIYNASAFLLPEGSMLDGLLAQMPGVKIDTKGIITVKGQPVSELLLDGKDILNGKTQLMLENIGAYMVKDIAIYHKSSRDSELMGRRVGKDPYVMDVRLKRQYAQGWVVNAEGGYGTEDRYLGRLFGMWYSEYVALTVYGGANNLSDERTPGREDKSWAVTDMGRGTVTRQQGGVSYLVKGYDDRYELKGLAEATNRIDDTRRSTSIEWFQQPANLYGYEWRSERNRQFGVETSHEWFVKLGNKANLKVEPKFRYENRDRNSERLTATMREKLDLVTHDGIAAIYSSNDSLKDKVMNRLREEQAEDGTSLSARLYATSSIKLSKSGMMRLWCESDWSDTRNDRFDRYRLAYGDASMSGKEYHRYYKLHPDFERSILGGASYTLFLGNGMQIPIMYSFKVAKNRHTTDMFALDRIPGYDMENSGLDHLPERDDYIGVLDPMESYLSDELVRRHFMKVEFRSGQLDLKRYACYIDFSATTDLLDRRYTYKNGGTDTSLDRMDVLPWIDLYIQLTPRRARLWYWNLHVNYHMEKPPMDYLISKPSKDPLVEIVGDRNLKNASNYNMQIQASHEGRHGISHRLSLYGYLGNNSISWIGTFDSETGRQRQQIFNDKGNRLMMLKYNVYVPFGRKKRFSLSSDSRFTLQNSEARYNPFNQYGATEELRLGWQKNPFNVSLFANVDFNSYDFKNKYTVDYSAWTCRYGATALLKLPKGWDVSTDLTLYTRRGYGDSRLNTTDLVWNARVSKSLFKGSLVLVADGYDLLRQLSNVSYTVNAQARTEVVTNVIPSYVLFHAQWRFNRQPRR